MLQAESRFILPPSEGGEGTLAEKAGRSPLSRGGRGGGGSGARMPPEDPMAVDDDELLLPVPIARSNTLHLSVGAPSDEEEDDCEEGTSAGGLNVSAAAMRRSITDWQKANAPTHSPVETDMMVLPRPNADAPFIVHEDDPHFTEALRDILQSGERLFQPIGDANFVEEVWHPKAPKVVKGYLFGGLIGEGSYAKVKEIVQERTLVRRAVKIIKDARLRKIPNGRENVERELRILGKLRHSNVIRLIEFFRDNSKNKLYIVMEYCVASMQQILDNLPEKRMAEAEAHSYFGQLIDGLEYVHSVGVVHKDLKPGNLLISRNHTLKISDFGVAEMLSPYHPSDMIENANGTPKFLPPEAVSGHEALSFSGFASDVWACGVTLYNMLSGEYPFEGAVIMRLFDAIAHQPLAMPTVVALPVDVQVLLKGMLEKAPIVRWPVTRIKECAWLMRHFEEVHYSPFPKHKKDPPHRPLTVYGALETMYLREEEVMMDVEGGANASSPAFPITYPMPVAPSVPTATTPPRPSSMIIEPPQRSSTSTASDARQPPRPPRRTRSFIPSCLRRQPDTP